MPSLETISSGRFRVFTQPRPKAVVRFLQFCQIFTTRTCAEPTQISAVDVGSIVGPTFVLRQIVADFEPRRLGPDELMIALGMIDFTVNGAEGDVKPMRFGFEIDQKCRTTSLAEDAVRAFGVGVTAEVLLSCNPAKRITRDTSPSRKGGAMNSSANRTMTIAVLFNTAPHRVLNC